MTDGVEEEGLDAFCTSGSSPPKTGAGQLLQAKLFGRAS